MMIQSAVRTEEMMSNLREEAIRLVSANQKVRDLAKTAMRSVWKSRYRFARFRNKTNDRLWVFEVYQGRKYTCSPKAIYEELLKKEAGEGDHFIWVFRDPEKFRFLEKNPNTSLVKLGSREYYEAFARARFWIVNSRSRHCLVPDKDQIFLNTWHGTPLKRLGCDISVSGNNNMVSLEDMKNDYRMEGRRVTYFLSPSRFYSEKIASAFGLSDQAKKHKLLELGYPRNDDLFRGDSLKIAAIKEKLGIPEGKKVLLYAPTFRDDQHTGGGLAFTLGFSLENFCQKLGDEYVMLFRTHYFVTEALDISPYKKYIIDVTDYEEINDLYLVSDLLITDYSSVFFDYANLKRPILFYMYDLEAYRDNIRDFYLNPEDLPGDIIRKEEDLYRAIREIGQKEVWDERYQAFHKRFNYLDGPDTARKVIDWLKGRPNRRR